MKGYGVIPAPSTASERGSAPRVSNERLLRDRRRQPHGFAEELRGGMKRDQTLPAPVMIEENRLSHRVRLLQEAVLRRRETQAPVLVASEFAGQPQNVLDPRLGLGQKHNP